VCKSARRKTYLKRLAVDDETAVELGLEELELIPHLIRSLDCTSRQNIRHTKKTAPDARFAIW
jgi:hypothetical protein